MRVCRGNFFTRGGISFTLYASLYFFPTLFSMEGMDRRKIFIFVLSTLERYNL